MLPEGEGACESERDEPDCIESVNLFRENGESSGLRICSVVLIASRSRSLATDPPRSLTASACSVLVVV